MSAALDESTRLSRENDELLTTNAELREKLRLALAAIPGASSSSSSCYTSSSSSSTATCPRIGANLASNACNGGGAQYPAMPALTAMEVVTKSLPPEEGEQTARSTAKNSTNTCSTRAEDDDAPLPGWDTPRQTPRISTTSSQAQEWHLGNEDDTCSFGAGPACHGDLDRALTVVSDDVSAGTCSEVDEEGATEDTHTVVRTQPGMNLAIYGGVGLVAVFAAKRLIG